MKKLVLLLSLLSVMLLTACGRYSAWYKIKTVSDWYGLTEESKYEETDNVKEELGSLSEDEKRILSRDGYSEKERIYASHLYDYEVKKVKNIRGAKEYLAEKYPDHEFRITLYESRGKKSTSPTGNIGDDLLWIEFDGVNSGKWVKVIESENGLDFDDNINLQLNN